MGPEEFSYTKLYIRESVYHCCTTFPLFKFPGFEPSPQLKFHGYGSSHMCHKNNFSIPNIKRTLVL